MAEAVADLAMPVSVRMIEREKHYRVNKPEVRRTYSSEDALLLSIKNKYDSHRRVICDATLATLKNIRSKS